MNKNLSILLIGLFFLLQGVIQAQDSKGVQLNIGADLMSRYVWRGTQFGGASPSLQPSLTLTINNFEMGFWSAYSIGGINPFQEFDFYMSYTFLNGLFTATISDYFFPTEGAEYDYFDYNENSTGHILEGTLSFNGSDDFPISILVAINFFGADAPKIESDPASADFNEKTGIQHSTYIELGYSTSAKDISLDFFVGAALNSPKKENTMTGFIGEPGFYGTKAGIVNLGVTAGKEIAISDKFSLPVSASVITNPLAKSVFFVFGILL